MMPSVEASKATFTLQALVLNSDLLLRYDFLFGCSHYFLIVTNIRSGPELTCMRKRTITKGVTRSTLSYRSKHGGH